MTAQFKVGFQNIKSEKGNKVEVFVALLSRCKRTSILRIISAACCKEPADAYKREHL